jgi:AraC-like DNA-binding protein
MDTIFSTDTVHPRDRFDCWHEVACKRIVGHHSRALSALGFEAHLEAASLADLSLVAFQNSPMDVARTKDDIAQAQNDDLFICRQLAGRLVLEQQDREVSLEAGEFCLLDPLLPYTGIFRGCSKMLVVKASRRAVEVRVGNTSMMTARALSHGSVGALTSGYLAYLPASSAKPNPRAALLQEQALDLVAASLSDCMAKEGASVSSPRSLALLKLRAAVEVGLADPKLSTSAAAAAAGMSVRYANLILADQGTSLGRLIQERRLDRCRRALEDPTQGHRTITEIAFSWGFSDQSHFSRSFKSRFGLSPRDFRARATER